MDTTWQGWDLSYLPDVFGALYMGGSVEVALRRTLQMWLPTYLAEINRQLEGDFLAVPQDYLYQPTERTIDAGTAQVMVVVPGTIGMPTRSAGTGQNGATRTTFDARVSVFYGGTEDFNESRAIGNGYVAAVIGAIAQHPGLGDVGANPVTGLPQPFAEGTKWHGYKIGTEARSATLWRMTSLVMFGVTLSNAMSPFGGPTVPSVLAPAEPTEVIYTGVTITQEEPS